MTKYFSCSGCPLKAHKLPKSFKLQCSSMSISLSQRYCQWRVCDGDFDKGLNWTKAWSALWGLREPCWIFILLKKKWNSHSHFMCNLARIIGGKMKRMYSWKVLIQIYDILRRVVCLLDLWISWVLYFFLFASSLI